VSKHVVEFDWTTGLITAVRMSSALRPSYNGEVEVGSRHCPAIRGMCWSCY